MDHAEGCDTHHGVVSHRLEAQFALDALKSGADGLWERSQTMQPQASIGPGQTHRSPARGVFLFRECLSLEVFWIDEVG